MCKGCCLPETLDSQAQNESGTVPGQVGYIIIGRFDLNNYCGGLLSGATLVKGARAQ